MNSLDYTLKNRTSKSMYHIYVTLNLFHLHEIHKIPTKDVYCIINIYHTFKRHDMLHFIFMVFNATFKNISVISWLSVLLVEETGGPGDNYRFVASHWQTLLHNVVHRTLIEIQLTTSLVIGTDCIGSLKFNYHTITTTTAPGPFWSIKEFSNFSNDGHLGWSLDQSDIF